MRFKLRMNDVGIDSPQSDVWQDMVERLGGAEALAASARLHGAFQRSRKIKSAEDLLRLVLAYGPGGRSLRLTAAEAAGCEIADICGRFCDRLLGKSWGSDQYRRADSNVTY